MPGFTSPRGRAVRMLLIDTHYSFRFNLYTLIAKVTGIAPVVVRNDVDFLYLPLSTFDAIVISPTQNVCPSERGHLQLRFSMGQIKEVRRCAPRSV